MNSDIQTLSVPAKTFLAGEYLTVAGGPALVATTYPSFDFAFSDVKHNDSRCLKEAFHRDGPAGKFISSNANASHIFVQKTEPFASTGGFGGSTADFIALYQYMYNTNVEPSVWDLWSTYRKCSALARSQAQPSGSDLVAQALGGLLVTEPLISYAEQFTTFPFTDIEVHIVKTNAKVPTHEHLQTLDASDIPIRQLSAHFEVIAQALIDGASDKFLEGMTNFGRVLENASLTCHNSLDLLQELRLHKGIVGAKGCGALGADTLAICVDAEHKEYVTKILEDKFEVVLCVSECLSKVRNSFAY